VRLLEISTAEKQQETVKVNVCVVEANFGGVNDWNLQEEMSSRSRSRRVLLYTRTAV